MGWAGRFPTARPAGLPGTALGIRLWNIVRGTIMETMGKVIQIPIDDGLLEEITRLSREEHRSRSELIRRACREYVKAREREELDRIYEEGYRRIPETSDSGESQVALLNQVLADESW